MWVGMGTFLVVRGVLCPPVYLHTKSEIFAACVVLSSSPLLDLHAGGYNLSPLAWLPVREAWLG